MICCFVFVSSCLIMYYCIIPVYILCSVCHCLVFRRFFSVACFCLCCMYSAVFCCPFVLSKVYFVVALLRTAQPSIMDAVSAGLYLHLGDLLPGGESALDGFDLADALSYMEGLERRHRPRCLAATEAYFAR